MTVLTEQPPLSEVVYADHRGVPDLGTEWVEAYNALSTEDKARWHARRRTMGAYWAFQSLAAAARVNGVGSEAGNIANRNIHMTLVKAGWAEYVTVDVRNRGPIRYCRVTEAGLLVHAHLLACRADGRLR